MSPAKPAKAKTVKAFHANSIFYDGRYVYYTGSHGESPRDGIRCLDTKTGKIKKIFEKKLIYGGFSDILVKGKYIYFIWNKKGGIVDEQYVYRVNKNGKKAKKLAIGCDIKLVGNRIYYTKCKLVNDKDDGICTETVGEASMNLDGSNKRREKGIKYSWKNSSPAMLVKYQDKTDLTTGNYYYYLKNNGRNLFRIHLKTGKEKKLYTCGVGEEIDSVYAHKDAVIFNVVYYPQNENTNPCMKKIYVSSKGKKKILRNKITLVG